MDLKFTNHSLRATNVTRLFHGDVSEKVMRTICDHRSKAILKYERSSLEQFEHSYNVIQGKIELERSTNDNNEACLAIANTQDIACSSDQMRLLTPQG